MKRDPVDRAKRRPERAEYHPRQLWESSWDAPSRPEVDAPAPVLYDAQERPLRRQIGFKRCQ
jgi:hypothetical protein